MKASKEEEEAAVEKLLREFDRKSLEKLAVKLYLDAVKSNKKNKKEKVEGL
jgi:hypothetical protein